MVPAEEATREKLIRVATDLLEREGLAAVTLREVGRLSGLSRSAPYRHFTNKSGLLAAVAGRGLLALHADLVEAEGSAADPVGRLEAMSRAHLRFAADNPALYPLIFSRETVGADDAGLDEAARTTHQLFVSTVADGVRQGLLPAADPQQLAAVMLATAHGAAGLARAGHLTAAKWGIDAEGALALLTRGLDRRADADPAGGHGVRRASRTSG
jgi:AcrR family transcriptional regulator